MTPLNKISDEDFRRACDRLREGCSLEVAAREIGRSTGGLVHRIRDEGGRAALGIPPAITWANVKEHGPRVMSALLLAGASVGVLCERWGLTSATGTARIQWMKIHGFLPKDFRSFDSKHVRDTRHDDAIIAAFDAGKDPDEIGHDLFVPGTFVRKRMLAIGLLERPKPAKQVKPDDGRERPPPRHLMTDTAIASLYAGRSYRQGVSA